MLRQYLTQSRPIVANKSLLTHDPFLQEYATPILHSYTDPLLRTKVSSNTSPILARICYTNTLLIHSTIVARIVLLIHRPIVADKSFIQYFTHTLNHCCGQKFHPILHPYSHPLLREYATPILHPYSHPFLREYATPISHS